jgi:hypothetical protein
MEKLVDRLYVYFLNIFDLSNRDRIMIKNICESWATDSIKDQEQKFRLFLIDKDYSKEKQIIPKSYYDKIKTIIGSDNKSVFYFDGKNSARIMAKSVDVGVVTQRISSLNEFEIKTFVKEITGAIKYSGDLIICDYDYDGDVMSYMYLNIIKLFDSFRRNGNPAKFFLRSKREIESILLENGFVKVEDNSCNKECFVKGLFWQLYTKLSEKESKTYEFIAQERDNIKNKKFNFTEQDLLLSENSGYLNWDASYQVYELTKYSPEISSIITDIYFIDSCLRKTKKTENLDIIYIGNIYIQCVFILLEMFPFIKVRIYNSNINTYYFEKQLLTSKKIKIYNKEFTKEDAENIKLKDIIFISKIGEKISDQINLIETMMPKFSLIEFNFGNNESINCFDGSIIFKPRSALDSKTILLIADEENIKTKKKYKKEEIEGKLFYNNVVARKLKSYDKEMNYDEAATLWILNDYIILNSSAGKQPTPDSILMNIISSLEKYNNYEGRYSENVRKTYENVLRDRILIKDKIEEFNSEDMYLNSYSKETQYLALSQQIRLKSKIYHWGQLKLVVEQIHALVSFWDSILVPNLTVVYAGSYPGFQFLICAELFPTIKWELYDPVEMQIKHERIKPNKKYFSDEIARSYSKKDGIFFFSDIRSVDYRTLESQILEEEISKDMKNQMRWVEIINPYCASLKMRAPYVTEKEESNNFEYLDGNIFLQPYAGEGSTETRLIPVRDENGNYVRKEYSSLIYENQMFYHNSVVRQSKSYIFRGSKENYDDAAFLFILDEYIKKFSVNKTARELKSWIIRTLDHLSPKG